MIYKTLKKISVLLLIGLIIQSCSVLGLYQSKKEVTGDYEIELKPENSFGYYDMSINVIQGLAAFEGGFFTSQTSANKFLSINYLNNKGVSEFNQRLDIISHGQDLSLEKVSDTELYLYTTVGHYDEDGASGIVRIKVTLPESVSGKRDMSQMSVVIDQEYELKLRNSTPTLCEEGTHFAMRSGNTIIIATKDDVLNSDLSNAKQFDLYQSQLKGDNG
jgi:hypothetical protein